MRTIQFILISLVVSIVSATVSQTALAQKGVRLVGFLGGDDSSTLSIDIGMKFIILGSLGPDQDFATIFEGEGERWKEAAHITAKDHDAVRATRNEFGRAVAITDIHGQSSTAFAVIGAPRHDESGDSAGAAYIFGLSGSDWGQQARLFAGDAEAGDAFGTAVAIDRTTAIVGSPKDDDAGANSGSAYIFVREGGSWKQQGKLVPGDSERSDGFGEAVAIVGNTAIVGAPQNTHGGVKFAGAVYIFERDGDRWVEQTKLMADDPGKADRFGNAVAFGADTIVIGAPLTDTDAGQDAGSAYIFGRDGDKWQQQAKVFGKGARKGDNFGSGVATNGNIAFIGAPIRDEDAFASGAAYAFARVDGVWEPKEKVVPKDGAKDLHFGFSLAVSENTVVVASHDKTKCEECGWPHGDGAAAYVYNTVEAFGTPPFAVEPFGLRVTTLGQVKRTALYQNFPNPFNPETWLPYRLANEVPVTLHIYNVQGQLTRELDLGTQKAGGYLTRETAAYWDGRDGVGEPVSSGVYFYTLHAGPFQATRRMLILK